MAVVSYIQTAAFPPVSIATPAYRQPRLSLHIACVVLSEIGIDIGIAPPPPQGEEEAEPAFRRAPYLSMHPRSGAHPTGAGSCSSGPP